MNTQLSKSERKRRAKNIEQLANELAALPDGLIAELPCEPEILAEIRTAKNLKGGAKKRQLKYATKLLREASVDSLYDFLAKRKGSALKQNREFHNLEHLRDLLINEAVQKYDDWMQNKRHFDDNEPFTFFWESEIIHLIEGQLPGIDQQQLKNNAIQFARTRNRKFSRELFRVLKAVLEKNQYKKTQDSKNGI